MRYDLTDFEWSVIEPLLPKGKPGPVPKHNRQVLTASSGFCARAHRGAIYPIDTGLTPPPTIASTAGARPVFGIV